MFAIVLRLLSPYRNKQGTDACLPEVIMQIPSTELGVLYKAFQNPELPFCRGDADSIVAHK